MQFEHLKFSRQWELSATTTYKLGQCRGLLDSIYMVPLRPEIQNKLRQVSLIKGAQATTAIEGNTLTETEIQKIFAGGRLPESKAYQEQEVNNILQAMSLILADSESTIITPQLLQKYHHLVGKDLPAPFNATPGKFAQSQRVVGGYRCPPPGREKHQVEGLVKQLCDWLQKEFGGMSGKTSFQDEVIRAIVTHVYIEWIHPFDDGNGRTGRLIEFYLLLRAGVPDTCAHILSNHYNATRPEYYAQIQQCQNERQLTSFIEYAVTGFLDGLKEVWETIAEELLNRAWRGYVYDRFAVIKWKRPTFIRRRILMLEMSLGKQYDIESIQLASPEIAREYGKVKSLTMKRDIRSLIEKGLLAEDPQSGNISANIRILTEHYPAGLQE